MEEDYQKRLAEVQAAREAELQRKAFLQKVLEPGALERLMRIRLSSQEVYLKIFQTLYYLAQNGQLKGKLSEEKLKELAARFVERKEPTITRLSK